MPARITDYGTKCGAYPLTFMQMLASLIRGYQSHYRLNILVSSNGCTELSSFLTCALSNIDPERQLVENIFALDTCNLLALKLFSNTDNDWEDYSECGEAPQSFIGMLARCIVTYSSVNRLNAIIDTDVCTTLKDILSCPNDIEAETILVGNLFAVDDCGNSLIKLFVNTSTMTDYNVSCGEQNQSFYQLLARCIVLYAGHYYLNIASASGNCSDLHAFWTCLNNNTDPETALINSIFATDSCGHLAVKLFNNSQAQ